MLRPIFFASAGAIALVGFAAPANSQGNAQPPSSQGGNSDGAAAPASSQDDTQPPSSSQAGGDGDNGGGAATPASYQDSSQPSSNWNGFYSGFNVGGGFGSPEVCTTSANVAGAVPDVTLRNASALSQTGCAPVETAGVIGGVQTGYNFRFSNNFLVGLETDLNGLSQSGHGSFANAAGDSVGSAYAAVSSEKGVDWLGTLRARVGWLVTPNLLIYGTSGLVYGGTRGATSSLPAWTSGSGWTGSSGALSATQAGWTAGGGVEWMFMRNWSLKLEYLYYDLGPATWSNSPNAAFNPGGRGFGAANVSTSSTRFEGNIVRVGLNFHFGGGVPRNQSADR